jgi:hypothetical protein
MLRNAILRTLAFLLVALPGAAAAAERDVRIGLPNHGALFLRVPDGWEERISRPKPDEPPLILVTPASGPAFRIVISPVWPVTAEDKLPDADAIRAMMESGANAAKEVAVETEIPMQDLKGMGTVGTYFSVTDRNPAPGDFKNLTQGLARVGTIVVAFRVFTNGDRPAVLESALKMFRTMRHG